ISDEELREAYRTAGVGIFSLNHATANNAVLEAMACGIPIVATDISGVRDLVGDAGILTEHWNGESLAKGVIEILRDRDRAMKLGRAARDRVETLTYERVAEQMTEIYREIQGNGAVAG